MESDVKAVRVSNLAFNASEDEIFTQMEIIFRPFGKIASIDQVRVPRDRVAYIHFRYPGDAEAAIRNLPKMLEIFDRRCRVEAVLKGDSMPADHTAALNAGMNREHIAPPLGYRARTPPPHFRTDYAAYPLTDRRSPPPRGRPAAYASDWRLNGSSGDILSDRRDLLHADHRRSHSVRDERDFERRSRDDVLSPRGAFMREDSDPPPEKDPLACRVILAGNLEPDITENEMIMEFSRFGSIISIDLRRPIENMSLPYALITYENVDMAYKAKRAMNNKPIRGFICRVRYAKQVESPCLMVGNLGAGSPEKMDLLEMEFDRFGAIKKVYWPEGSLHAFVCFESLDAAIAAAAGMRGFQFKDGGKLHIEFADPEAVNSKRKGIERRTSGSEHRRTSEHKRGGAASPTTRADHRAHGSAHSGHDSSHRRTHSERGGASTSSDGRGHSRTRSERRDAPPTNTDRRELSDRREHSDHHSRDSAKPEHTNDSQKQHTGGGSSSSRHRPSPIRAPTPNDKRNAPTNERKPRGNSSATNDHERNAIEIERADRELDRIRLERRQIDRDLDRNDRDAPEQQRQHRDPEKKPDRPDERNRGRGARNQRRDSGHRRDRAPPARRSDGEHADKRRRTDNDAAGSTDVKRMKLVAEVAPVPCAKRKTDLDAVAKAETIAHLTAACFMPWEGPFVLKNSAFGCKLHVVDGEASIVEMVIHNAESGLLKITQRLRLDPVKLEEVTRRIAAAGENGYCTLVATPGSGAKDVKRFEENLQQRPLKNLVTYLKQKEAAGVVMLGPVNNSNGIIHAFPPCDFANEMLKKVAPKLNVADLKDDFMVMCVVKVN